MSVDVLVFGAGAIGQYLGGRLAAAGLSVHFVARPRVVAALRERGLRVTELDGAVTTVAPERIGASDDLAHAPAAKLILVTVKSAATAAAGAALDAAQPAGTAVVSFQNGVDNADELRAAAPRLVVVPGMVPFNVVQPEPGVVQRTTSGTLAVGRAAALAPFAAAFARAGLPLDQHADMRPVQWAKLLLNLNNPINAIAGVPLREQLLDRDYRVVLAALQDEALEALRAAGIAPARVTPVPTPWIPTLLRLPTPLFRVAAQRMLSIHPAARSSMYDDRGAGRPTEIGALCGAVVRLAERCGVDAPRNRALVRVIETIPPGEYWSGARLRERIGV
jgi:2-dehydropantoate 2-reductase